MSHPTKRPLLHGQAPSTSNEPALPILEARFGVIAQALTGSTIATSAYSTIIPALQSFLSPALTVTRGQVFGPTSTTATLPTTSPHPLQGLLIIDRSYPSISASPSSPAASDHWFPIESVAGYIELSDAYDEYELVRLRASIDQLHKLSLQSDTRRSSPIPVFHLCLSSGTASLASAASTSLDLHVVAHSVALRFAHDTGMKGVFILNEGMVVRHDCLFPSGTAMATQPSTAPFVVARIKTHGHGPILGMSLLLAHALAGVNNETSRNAHLIKQYAKASVWQATAPEPRSHQATARSSVIAATAAAAQSVIQHVNKQQQQSQAKKQESTPAPSQTQPPSQPQAQPSQTQPQQPSQQKKGRGKKQAQPQGDKLSQTQPIKSRPQSATSQKKGETQEKKEEKKSDIQEKKEETKTASPSQAQKQPQQQKQRPKSARTSMSATMNVEKKPRPSTAGPDKSTTSTEKSTTSVPVDVDDDGDDTDVRTDVDLTVVGTHVSGIVGDVKPTTANTENKKKGKGKKGGKQQQQQDETKQTSKPAVPVQNKSSNNHTTPGGPPTTTNTNTSTATTNGTSNNKSSPNKKRNNRRSNSGPQRKNSNATYKPVTPSSNVPLTLPSPPKSTAQVLAEKLLTSPPTTEKKESKTPYDDDFNPFA